MDEPWLNGISPFVRVAKIMKSHSLSGEWMDYDYVYTYIEQGEAEFFLSGIKYLVKEGDVLLMHPYMSHIIKSTTSAPLIQYIFHFDLYYDEQRSTLKHESASTMLPEKKDTQEMRLASVYPLVHLQLSDQIIFKKRFLTMYNAYTDRKHGSSLLLKSICLELLYLFLTSQTVRKKEEGKMTKGWIFIEKAMKYVNERYHDPEMDNAVISSHVGVSTNHLSYLFKTQLGISIHKYVTHIRIEHAKKRIIQANQTLTEIADEVGFSSIHLFSRLFKQAEGIVPSKYAMSQRNNPS
ncbi:AraC family transcriptional regulator [Paenibacillus paridis]|uniref:AraC family transcriptional regulator n=1 Tax=Paenibacillus paridis TaxID=2583376 RepID=UPI001121BCA4|nr:AraC family transcriptional regulator [Paenibacillus paridis]